MIKSTGHADLPLHTGTVPKWLADRMMQLGTLIVESLVLNYGRQEVLTRLSDPLWFQSLGCVLGMDWHSSGITTSVMYALKRGLNARANELGIYICGGRGKYSRRTPEELAALSANNGLDAESLITSSKLCAKVDNTAVQDGFQLYQHNFILTKEGDWAVVQQGMNTQTRKARRYHWCSANLTSFVEEPHAAVVGQNQGKILNLTATQARPTRNTIMEISKEDPYRILKEIKDIAAPPIQFGYGGSIQSDQLSLFPEIEKQAESSAICTSSLIQKKAKEIITIDPSQIIYSGRNIIMPDHHDVQAQDVDLSRLGAVLATAWESQPKDFESLLLTPGLGPRTVQSLTLVSEVIYGTPSRFNDPARFSFAHGGKDGHPFPVPLKIYDESIRVLQDSIEKSKLGYNDKSQCLQRLHSTALSVEKNCAPQADFQATLNHENSHSKKWGGKTCFD